MSSLHILYRMEGPINHKWEKTNKKGFKKTPISSWKNTIKSVIPQLNTVQCPRISNPPNPSSSPPMSMLWDVLTWLIVRILKKMTKPLKVGNFNYKILLQQTLCLHHPSSKRKPSCLSSKEKFNQFQPLGRKSSGRDMDLKFKIFEEKQRCLPKFRTLWKLE